jgi:hypothetical protein
MTEHNDRQYREEDFSVILVNHNSKNPRVRALALLLDELEYPNRDLRLSAQVLNCKKELEEVVAWLRAEVEREAQLEVLFEDPHSDDGLPSCDGDGNDL